METKGRQHRVTVIGFDSEGSDGLWDTNFNTMKQREARLKWIRRKGWKVKKERVQIIL